MYVAFSLGSQFNTRDESNDKVKHPNTFWEHITILRSLHTVTHSTHKIETTRLSWGLWTLNNRSGYLSSALRTKNLSLVHPLFKLNSIQQFRVILRPSPLISLHVSNHVSTINHVSITLIITNISFVCTAHVSIPLIISNIYRLSNI